MNATATRVFPRGMTDAEPVRQHLRDLMAANVTRRHAADLAGISRHTVSRILYRTARQPSRAVRIDTAERILAVTPAAGQSVDATGTRRQLKALGCDGYDRVRIARELDVLPTVVGTWLRYATISAGHHQAVADLYKRWAGIPAETNGSSQAEADAARAMAYRRRWAPASSWVGEDMDDPEVVPSPWRRTHRAVDLYEDSEALMRAGVSIEQAAMRLGATVPALKLARERVEARARAVTGGVAATMTNGVNVL